MMISGTTLIMVAPGMRLDRTLWPWEVKSHQWDRLMQILWQVQDQAGGAGSNEGPEIAKDCEKLMRAMHRRGGPGRMPGAAIFTRHEHEGMFYLFVNFKKNVFHLSLFCLFHLFLRFQRDTRKCIQDGSSDFVKGHGV